MNVPTTIFTGFLGSGKTTIISHLIDYLQTHGEQVIYIKNEIGDTDIDSLVMKQKGVETEELLNGCICCTLVGPFLNSIDELIHKFKPTRIIIEASGAADPAALALMVSSHPTLIRDGVIGVIDVLNFEGYEDLTITAKEQTKFTDILIFNKVELVNLEQKRRVVGYVRELNTHSPIIEAHNGTVDPSVVFGSSSRELEMLLASHNQHDSHKHIATDNFESITISSTNTYDADVLSEKLNTIPRNILRAKGIVVTRQGVQVFNTVAGRTTFAPFPNEVESKAEKIHSVFVFIGVGIHNQHQELKETFK